MNIYNYIKDNIWNTSEISKENKKPNVRSIIYEIRSHIHRYILKHS